MWKPGFVKSGHKWQISVLSEVHILFPFHLILTGRPKLLAIEEGSYEFSKVVFGM